MTQSFRTSHVARAVKAVQSAGLKVTAVVVSPDGTVRIETAETDDPDAELEAARARRALRKAERRA